MKNQSGIEYLIENENVLPEEFWQDFSSNPETIITLVEARLFRKRINWDVYFRTHKDLIFPNALFLEVASKYFTEQTYKILASFYALPEEFVEAKFDCFVKYIPKLVKHSNLSEEFFLKHFSQFENETIEFLKLSKFTGDCTEYLSLKLALQTI